MIPKAATEPTQPARLYLIANVGTLMMNRCAISYPYHLALAQFWHIPEYRSAYRSIQYNYNPHLILDNGAHEGQLVDDDTYLSVVEDLQPHVVVLPDLIDHHHQASRERSLKFVDRLEKVCPGVQYLYAAQGENQQQILDEYLWAFTQLDSHKYRVGFGQSYLQWARPQAVNYESPRYAMLRELYSYISNNDGDTKRMRCHILGARWHPKDLTDLWWRFRFTGIDTIKPVTCCFMGTTYPVRKPDYRLERESFDCASETDLATNIISLIEHYGLNAEEAQAVRPYLSLK